MLQSRSVVCCVQRIYPACANKFWLDTRFRSGRFWFKLFCWDKKYWGCHIGKGIERVVVGEGRIKNECSTKVCCECVRVWQRNGWEKMTQLVLLYVGSLLYLYNI